MCDEALRILCRVHRVEAVVARFEGDGLLAWVSSLGLPRRRARLAMLNHAGHFNLITPRA